MKTYYCEECGKELIESKEIDSYNPFNGEAIYLTLWVCPDWRRLSWHTKLAGTGSFEQAYNYRKLVDHEIRGD